MVSSDTPTSTIERSCFTVRLNSISPEDKLISTVQTSADGNNEDPYHIHHPKVVCSISLDMIDEYQESGSTVSAYEISCSICLEVLDQEEGNLFSVPSCNHVFHIHCIIHWKKEGKNCPICRGALPKDIAPALSTTEDYPIEEDIPDITRWEMFENLMLLVFWIVYPVCLLSLVFTVEVAAFALFIVPLLFIAIYYLLQTEDFIYAIILIILLCFISPVVICCILVVFIVQTFYMIYRTMKFYIKVFMCEIRWNDGYSFIIGRTMAVSKYWLSAQV